MTQMVVRMSTVILGELSILYFCHNSPVITVGIRIPFFSATCCANTSWVNTSSRTTVGPLGSIHPAERRVHWRWGELVHFYPVSKWDHLGQYIQPNDEGIGDGFESRLGPLGSIHPAERRWHHLGQYIQPNDEGIGDGFESRGTRERSEPV